MVSGPEPGHAVISVHLDEGCMVNVYYDINVHFFHAIIMIFLKMHAFVLIMKIMRYKILVIDSIMNHQMSRQTYPNDETIKAEKIDIDSVV